MTYAPHLLLWPWTVACPCLKESKQETKYRAANWFVGPFGVESTWIQTSRLLAVALQGFNSYTQIKCFLTSYATTSTPPNMCSSLQAANSPVYCSMTDGQWQLLCTTVELELGVNRRGNVKILGQNMKNNIYQPVKIELCASNRHTWTFPTCAKSWMFVCFQAEGGGRVYAGAECDGNTASKKLVAWRLARVKREWNLQKNFAVKDLMQKYSHTS